jgi:hypothetical protein
MAQPDVVQLYKLMRRLDRLCEEASAIRDELAKAAGRHPSWPDPPAVAQPATKSVTSSDFLPTSTDDSVN